MSLVTGEGSTRTEEGDTGEWAVKTQHELQSDGFKCPICSLLYRRCADLNRHMKSKHNVRRKDFFNESRKGSCEGSEEESLELPDEEAIDFADDSEEFVEAKDFEDDEDFDDENDFEEEEEESLPLAKLLPRLSSQQKSRTSLKCSYCSYIAKWPSDLRRHLLVHSVEKRFKCSLCWKKYKYLGDLNVHLRRDHEVDPDADDVIAEKVNIIPVKKAPPSSFRCPTCPFTTRFKAEMDRHRSTHSEQKSYLCKMCDYQTYWRGDMGRHLYRRHPDKVAKEADISEFFEFHPEHKALTKTKAGRETRSWTPEMDDSPEASPTEHDASVIPTDSVPGTASPLGPDKGYEETRDKDGNKAWRCKHCTYLVNTASKMREHLNTHYNLKQFKCPACGQRANWKYDIRKHLTVKHPGHPKDVVTLSVEEAKATIEEYMKTMPNIRRDHHFNSGELVAGEKSAQKTYRCSECQFHSDHRWSVSKHQRSCHAGQPNVSIMVFRKRENGDDDENSRLSTASQRTRSMTPETSHVKRERQESPMDLSPDKKGQAVLVADKGSGDIEVHDDVDSEDKVGHQYKCAVCGKTGVTKGDIKKHYNYIHPNADVCIINIQDGVLFNYYTGLPMDSPDKSKTSPTLTPAGEPSPSKVTDPKSHGYVKPFQCSVCGQRSNWKWDVKKHLRIKHPNTQGYVIVLQIEQARATYPGRQFSNSGEAGSLASSGAASSSVKEEVEGSVSGKEDIISPSSDMTNRLQEMKMGRYRRYKCSKCGYRSNWRTDIVRHIERLHNNKDARLIFLDVETAKQTFMEYDYKPATPVIVKRPAASPMASPTAVSKLQLSCTRPTGSNPSTKFQHEEALQGRGWYCPKCSFTSCLKSHILDHMQGHGMKAFQCAQCRFACRFRSPLYRHIRSQHSTTEYSKYAKIVIKFYKPPARPATTATELYVDAYLCRLCSTVESESQEKLLQHLQDKHQSSDPTQALKVRKRVRPEVPGDGSVGGDGVGGSQNSRGSGRLVDKRYFCTLCPYRTDKRGMLTFHHAYHQPSGQNRHKCKYCPYYVCHARLLHQHMKWHDEYSRPQAGGKERAEGREVSTWSKAGEKTPPSSPSKRGRVMTADTTPKRHNCEKCPYTTNSKNDFIYHKQFHRPKPAAEYKCDHCDYWVTHRRLLKQHMKLHGDFSLDDESLVSSPIKSVASDASAILDAVEIAAIKQKMITNKITASLSTSPAVSPMKIAMQCSVGNRPGFVLRDGLYRKLHQCGKCPYTNIRPRNLRLHQLMHGQRKSDHLLMKCPHCDYYVGSKGLLSHHMKVHLQHYLPDPSESTTFDLEQREGVPGSQPILALPDEDDCKDVFASPDIPQKHKVDTLLEISRFKRYSCEKCPYASAKRSHFTRHMELHGSRQRHSCEYCDYSVPSGALLTQHRKMHMMPNQNLLATQSFSNLQHMNEVPADVALASALPPTDSAEPVTISVIHDHLELYENDDTNSFDLEPKKLYRCDRCPYANVKRDHLLTHLRFHMQRSSFQCPYCDYSVPKQQLLTQHIRVHFCPLPELSDWLIENGQTERAQEVNDVDLTRALEVAEKYQNSPKRKLNQLEADGRDRAAKKMKTDAKDTDAAASSNSNAADAKDAGEGTSKEGTTAGDAAEAAVDKNTYICQYCDREFATSKQLISHEMQHLIGNHFEFFDDGDIQGRPAKEKPQAEENSEPLVDTSRKKTTSAPMETDAGDKKSPDAKAQTSESTGQGDDGQVKDAAKSESDVTLSGHSLVHTATGTVNNSTAATGTVNNSNAATGTVYNSNAATGTVNNSAAARTVNSNANTADKARDKREPMEDTNSDKMEVCLEEKPEKEEEMEESTRRNLRPKGEASNGPASNGAVNGTE